MKKIVNVTTVVLLLALLLTLVPTAALAQQEEVVCDQDAVVQAEDSLSNLAAKYYGNVMAYPVIVDATNAKAEVDSSYTKITDPNVIESGSKLCIPPGEVAQKMLNEQVFTTVTSDEAASTLVIGLTEDSFTLDPSRAYELHAISIHRPIYETLVSFPPGRVDEIVPGLAESWTISDDGLVYTFTLKSGPKFSTGRPVTAADVAFSLNRIHNLKGNPSFLTDSFASVEAADERTAVINLKESDPALLAKLAFTSLGVMDSTEAQAQGATDNPETDKAEQWLNQNSIGSGPYMLQKWEPKVEAILVRNPNYASAPAAIDRVIYRTVSDAAAQKLALEAGDLDIGLDISADQVPSFKSNPNITVYEGSSDLVIFLTMNMDPQIGGPLSQAAVQQAVRLAIDYEGIRQLSGAGAATPVNIIPVHWAYALSPAQGIKRDVAAAKAKLAEAGFGNGATVELEYPEFTLGGLAFSTLAQKIQADLTEAGITVQLKPADINVALENYRNGKENMGLWYWGPDYIDPIDRLAFTPDGKVGLRVNWTKDNASPELMAAVERAKVVTKPAERESAFTEIQQRMLVESPFVFVVQNGTQVAYNSAIKGFTYDSVALGRINPYTMSK